MFMLYFSSTILGVVVNPILFIAVFLIIYSVYSFNRLTDQAEDCVNIPGRSALVKDNENTLLVISTFAYIIALCLCWYVNVLAMISLLIPFILGVIYSKRILWFPRLKNILVVKNVVVALSWTVCMAFLPALYLKDLTILWFIVPFLFTKMFINTVLFDVKDIRGDVLNGINTIPAAIGVPHTKRLLLVIQSLLTILTMVFLSIFNGYYLILIISMAYGYICILYLCTENGFGRYLLNIFVDGEWIIMCILLWCIV